MTNKAKKLKLYVWEEYAPDYSPGLAFAIAENVNDTYAMLKEKEQFLCDCGPVVEYDIEKIAFARCGGM